MHAAPIKDLLAVGNNKDYTIICAAQTQIQRLEEKKTTHYTTFIAACKSRMWV